MKKTALAASALAVAATLLPASIASADVQPNIVGGTGATGNTSWMVSLQFDSPKNNRFNYHTCGGSLVFRNWVVTNAHCVTDMPPELAKMKSWSSGGCEQGQPIPTADKQFKVRVGSKDRTTGGETANVVQVVVHPGWHWGGDPMDDITMLKLDHAVNMQPIQLAGRAAKAGDRIRLYGWGVDLPDCSPNLPTQLQQLDTKVLPFIKCAEAGQTAGEICTNNPHKTDGPGPGDSGGPAVQFKNGEAQLVGSCSRGASAFPGESPTVYTSEPDFRDWIYNTARGVKAA